MSGTKKRETGNQLTMINLASYASSWWRKE